MTIAYEPGGMPAEPPAELLYKHRFSLVASVREVWGSRSITWALSERQLRSRYKNSLLGFAWAFVAPLTMMAAFTLVFDRVAQVDTQGVPYQLFSYVGLISWGFFSSSVSSGSNSLLSNRPLLTKIRVPREVFPLSSVQLAAVDAGLSSTALVAMFFIYTYMPKPTIVWIPVLLVVQLAVTIGWALVAAVVSVYLRDVRQALPLVLQFGLFVTPVGFGLEVIPEKWRGLYSFLNPLGPVIDGYRRTILYGEAPQWDLLGLGALGALIVLVGGHWLFKKLEPGMADVS
jgi:ABC-2 type transport system permease protein/lipopolysaccharide transport system permease protein